MSSPSAPLARAVLIVAAATPAVGHDLFLRPDAFFVAAGQKIAVTVLSGTFSRSENAIARDRLADLSIVSPAGRAALDTALWTEEDPESTLAVPSAESGTYVLGAAVRPRLLKLPAAEFDAYLEEEGLDHVLAARRAQGRTQEGSRERYSKFVKALVQVGETTSDEYDTSLGHAAELLPLSNPYALKTGDVLSVRCVVDGRPAAGQIAFAGGRTPAGARIRMTRLVADGDGVLRVRLTSRGAWYVKFVHMREVADTEANYESRWSTLTWGVR